MLVRAVFCEKMHKNELNFCDFKENHYLWGFFRKKNFLHGRGKRPHNWCFADKHEHKHSMTISLPYHYSNLANKRKRSGKKENQCHLLGVFVGRAVPG